MATARNMRDVREVDGSSFEQSFQSLQEVVRKLSEGNLTLQEALASFEEGMALADRCGAMLEEAELRVKQVSERAMRAGNAAARDAAASTAFSPIDLDEPEVLAFEIETFESTILFEPLDNKPGGRGSGATSPGAERSGSTQGRGFQAERKPSAPRTTRPPSILDPLFDEDD
jgi:exodeoxyribonuclease VII small subunit